MSDLLQYARKSTGDWTGFRLSRVELRNFGGYHCGIDNVPTVFNFDDSSAVFSGEVGAGKSTVIDALRLFFRSRPHFNSATDASSRDRSVRSYALGQFANDHGPDGPPSRLRNPDDPNQAMAILAVFKAADGRVFTVARMFLARGSSDGEWHNLSFPTEDVSLKHDLKKWGTKGEIARLAASLGGERHDRQDDFFTTFGRLIGFEGDRFHTAFTLFETAISAQRMGSVDEFARKFLLPEYDFRGRADTVRKVAEETGAAQAKIQHKRRELNAIDKVVAAITAHEKIEAEHNRIFALANVIGSARDYANLLGARSLLNEHKVKLGAMDAEAATLTNQASRKKADLEALRNAIANSDGGRIETMKADIARKTKERDNRITQRQSIEGDLAALGLPKPADSTALNALPAQVSSFAEKARAERQARRDERDQVIADLAPLNTQKSALDIELADLERHGSVIPGGMIDARNQIAAEIGLEVDDLPFLGEILRVRPGEEDWSEAVNRAVGGSAHDIIVHPDNYAQAIQVQASRNWGCRVSISCEAGSTQSGRSDALYNKMEVNPEARLGDQALAIIMRLAPHTCVDESDYGRAPAPAATRGGALKSGSRSVKDDSRSGKTLIGWSVEARQNEVKRDLESLAKELTKLNEIKSQLDAGEARFEQRLSICERVELNLVPHDKIAVGVLEGEIEDLEIRCGELENGEIRKMQESKARLTDEITDTEGKLRDLDGRRGGLRRMVEQGTREVESITPKVREAMSAGSEVRRGMREAILAAGKKLEIQGDTSIEVGRILGRLEQERQLSNDPWQRLVRDRDAQRDAIARKISEGKGKLSRKVEEFFSAFPERKSHDLPDDIHEMDETTAARRNAWVMRQQSIHDSELLPLEEDYRRDTAARWGDAVQDLKKSLTIYRDTITRMTQEINKTLRDVTYDPTTGTRAQISITPSKSPLLKDFLKALDEALVEVATGEAGDSAKKVMGFIEETENKSQDEDRQFLIDLRNHYYTEVREYRWENDDLGALVNTHRSAGAASGGQGERLTLLLLGAGISYAFGQRDPQSADRALGVIVLDEAFLKSSTTAATAAAEVLRALNLQIIIATPMTHVGVLSKHAKRIFNITKINEQCQVEETRLSDIVGTADAAA